MKTTMDKARGDVCSAKMSDKIKEMWGRLSGEDIKLYAEDREGFLAKVMEKHSVTREIGERKLQEIEKSCAVKEGEGKSSPSKVA